VATREGWHGWDDYADFYDWENARTLGRRDVAFWRAMARGCRSPILELGCGTGRILTPIARVANRVVGVDRSAPMLSRAIQRARRLPRAGRPFLLRADIRNLPFRHGSFGLVIAAYGLLQSLLSDRDLDAVLSDAVRVLEPGGCLGVDLVPDLRVWDEYRRKVRFRGTARDGRRITLIETVRQERTRGVTIFDEEFVTRRGRAVHRRQFSLTFRTVAVETMVGRLARAGLDVESLAGDYSGASWTPQSPTWLIVARKR
jgi:SAM-dependent methyltransferase